MSRGLGKVEQELLTYLQDMKDKGMLGWWTLAQMTRLMHEPSVLMIALGAPMTDAPEYPSLKRAARSLARKGLIEKGYRGHNCYVRLAKCTAPAGTLNKAQEATV